MPSPPVPRAFESRKRGNKGIVRAIFAVTGVVDEVQDLILPGAFTRTLAARRVKSVWHHEWKDPVGIVLSIEEWLPGDPRFAQIPGGAVWPKGAGALVATIQFNLRTTRGRDAYEQVKQWHENGEAQFSIGYKVPPGGASKRHDGVRIIHDLDLYEVSPVLHGAHPMTRSIEVKATAHARDMERKATWSAVELKAAEQQAGNGVMVALKVPGDVAEQIAHSDGTPAEHLHITLAYLGDVADLGGHPDDLRDIVTPAVHGTAPLAGSIGGIGRFPDSGDGEPTWVPVDVPGLAEMRQQVVQALAGSPYSESVRDNHGFTPHITLGYDLDSVDPVPSTPVSFPSVWVVRGGDEMEIPLAEAAEDDEPTGPPSPEAREFAENVMRTHDALPLEGKSAAQIVMEAKASGGWDQNKGIYPAAHAALEGKSAAQVVIEAKSAAQPLHLPERIMTTPMPYSFEQLRDQLCRAVRGLFAPDRDDDHGPGPAVASECYVSVEATYPDRVIVTRYDDGNTENYSVPYTLAGRDVDLGTPTRVELTTVATPISGGERDADPDEVVQARVIQPTGRALEDATALIQVSDAGPEHLQSLKPTITSLLNALSKKGMPMDERNPDDSEAPYGDAYSISDGWDDDEEDPGMFDDLDYGADQAPGGDGMPDGEPDDTGAPEEQDKVRLDASEVKAALAELAL